MKDDVKQDKKTMDEKDTSNGIDLKIGFKPTKIEVDGFKGRPAKISKEDGSYFSEDGDESQLTEYKLKGYNTTSKKDAEE